MEKTDKNIYYRIKNIFKELIATKESERNYEINSLDIKHLFIKSFFIRLVILILVLSIPNMDSGFIGNDYLVDDVRYELGGKYYSENATKLFDMDTFTVAFDQYSDNTGYVLKERPLSATALWYWIVCLLMYIFKSNVAVRLFNVIISSFSVIVVYKFAALTYGRKTAIKAGNLMAFLPYPVIFSCFSYKDNFIMLLTFYLLYQAVKFKKMKKMSFVDTVLILLSVFSMINLRGGLSFILIILCLFIAFSFILEKHDSLNKKNFKNFVNKNNIINFISLLVIVYIVVFLLKDVILKSIDIILYKAEVYLSANARESSALSIAKITGIKDIYKFPFTFLFSTFLPIGFFSSINNWGEIVGILNITLFPIGIASCLYVLKKKPMPLVYWICFLYYSISIIASIGIFRHYFSLIPLNIIAYSDYMEHCATKKEKKFVYICSVILLILFIIYFFKKNIL